MALGPGKFAARPGDITENRAGNEKRADLGGKISPCQELYGTEILSVKQLEGICAICHDDRTGSRRGTRTGTTSKRAHFPTD